MRKWIYKILLRNKQKKLLFEMEMDLQWLRTYKDGVISANEGELRDELGELNNKENKTEADYDRIQFIAETLAELKVVKSRYVQTLSNIKEMKQYIQMLSK